MKLIERKHLKAIHEMANHYPSWEWEYTVGGESGYGNIKCKLYYGKPKGYAKFIKIYSENHEVVTDFEKLNEYYPMEITDLTWDMLKVGYDLFLKELITKKRRIDMLKNKWKGGLTYD